MKFELAEPARVETHDALLGAVSASFPKGKVEPKSEHEVAALRKLEEHGLAREIPESSSASSTPKTEAAT